nr:hypothetical protein [Mycoplasmopsis agalactiae]
MLSVVIFWLFWFIIWIIYYYKDGENDNKNKADELFKKTKSKLEEAYKKISKHQ